MKAGTLCLLLVSHVGLLLAGGWLAGESRKEPARVASAPALVVLKAPVRATEETLGNPILRATAADFRAVWDESIASPQGGSEELFNDWCAVDPDGAFQALGRLPASKSNEDYLRAARMYHGADVAPAFVKHWRKLQRMPEDMVRFHLAGCVNELAKKDPETAGALFGSLPPRMREGGYVCLFSRQDSATIEQLLKGMPSLPPDATEEKQALWKGVAEALDTAGAQRGLWEWMAEADDTVARRVLVTEGMKKAGRNEDWAGFFDAVERMDATARAEVRDLVRQATSATDYRPEALSAISAECQRHGFDDWLEGHGAKKQLKE